MNELDSGKLPRCTHGKALLLLCLVLFMIKLWDGVLLEDPARYASVSKCILTTGDFITMHETPQQPYFNKPPLYFWLTAILFKAFGISIWAARFWSALAGLGSVMLLYDIVRRYFDERTGLLAGIVLALSNDFMRYSIAGRLDAPQVFFMVLALWGFVRATAGKSKWTALIPGLACGLGFLTKGPLILLVFPVIMTTVFFNQGNSWEFFKKKLFWLGILLGLALAAPWHILVAQANPDFWNLYFGREMLSRMQGELIADKSRLNFVRVLITHFLPWTPLALYGAWLAGVRMYRGDSNTPPPEEQSSASLTRHNLIAFGTFFSAWLIIAAIAAFAPPRMYGRYLMLLYPPLAGFCALGLVRLLPNSIMRHIENRLWLWAVFLGFMIMVLPIERHQSNNKVNLLEAAPIIRETVAEDGRVVIFHTEIHAPQAVIYFYTGRESVVVKTIEDLLALEAPVVITSKGGMNILQEHGYSVAVWSPKLTLAKRK